MNPLERPRALPLCTLCGEPQGNVKLDVNNADGDSGGVTESPSGCGQQREKQESQYHRGNITTRTTYA